MLGRAIGGPTERFRYSRMGIYTDDPTFTIGAPGKSQYESVFL